MKALIEELADVNQADKVRNDRLLEYGVVSAGHIYNMHS